MLDFTDTGKYQRRVQQELIAKNLILILKFQLMAVAWNSLPVTVAMMMSLPTDIHIEILGFQHWEQHLTFLISVKILWVMAEGLLHT
jgi:hypothetical protein